MQAHDWAWLDARESVTLSELSRICGLSAEELDELMGYGALVALQAAQPEPMFSAEFVAPLRTVARLRMELRPRPVRRGDPAGPRAPHRGAGAGGARAAGASAGAWGDE